MPEKRLLSGWFFVGMLAIMIAVAVFWYVMFTRVFG